MAIRAQYKRKAKPSNFPKKQFFNLVVSGPFKNKQQGTTCNTRIKTKQDLTPALLGRTFKVFEEDLTGNSGRIFKFRVNKVVGQDCIGEFDGMYLRTEKANTFVRKGKTLVETYKNLNVKGNDNKMIKLRVFTIGNTKNIKSSQLKELRKAINEELEKYEGRSLNSVIESMSDPSLLSDFNVLVRKIKVV